MEGLGVVSMTIEACIGIPQIRSNYTNQSVKGLSYFMLSLWVIGDSIKTVYLIN